MILALRMEKCIGHYLQNELAEDNISGTFLSTIFMLGVTSGGNIISSQGKQYVAPSSVYMLLLSVVVMQHHRPSGSLTKFHLPRRKLYHLNLVSAIGSLALNGEIN